MSDERRREYVEAVWRTLMRKAETDPAGAYVDAVLWLCSPEGALAWPWMWRREYRKIMVEIGYWLIRLATLSLG